MASLNKVMFIGNLGRDPETTYGSSGAAVTKFSIGMSDYWVDKASGEKKQHTEWARVVTFGKLAEICGKYLKKGMPVYVEGKQKTTSYEKDGATRYSTDTIASVVNMLGSKPKEGTQNNHPTPQNRPDQNRTQPDFDPFAGGGCMFPDDGIPF